MEGSGQTQALKSCLKNQERKSLGTQFKIKTKTMLGTD